MPLLAKTGTFDAAIDRLSKTLTDVQPLATSINDITTIVSDVDSVLASVDDLIAFANEIDNAIIALGEALEFLAPVPIVGEVAETFSGGLQTLGEVFKDAVSTANQM